MDQQEGFLAQEESSSKLTRYLVGIGAAILFALIGKPLIQTFFHPRWTAERVGAELERDPQMGDVYVALRENYPADSRRLLEQAAADANANDMAAADRNAFLFMRRFTQGKSAAITAAPADLLHRIAQEYSALFHVLRNSDPALCGRFVTEGFRPGDQPPAYALEHVGRLAALQIRAAHAGESSGRVARGELSDRDGAAFGEAVRANDPAAARLIADPAALRAATPERQCDAGTAIYDAAAELPRETSGNVVAQLLRDSLRQ